MLKMVATPSPQLSTLTQIAYQAGVIIMRHYEVGTQTRRKVDHSPVTDADEEAEAFIVAELKREFSGISIVAEEEVASTGLPNVGSRFFLVDPLDGTKEFIDRNGEFTVNIAEIENGAAIRGVVYAPAKGRLFAGEKPGGAFEMDAPVGRIPDLDRFKPISVRKAPSNGLIAVASRSHRD